MADGTHPARRAGWAHRPRIERDRKEESTEMTRSSRWGWGRSAAVGGITALAVGALASLGAAVSPSRTPAAASQYPKKVTICHHTHSKKNPFVTITVSRNALPAHLGHGDSIAPCPASKGKGTHPKKGKKHKAPAQSARARSGTAGSQTPNAPGHSGSTPRHSAPTPGHTGKVPSPAPRSPSDRGNAPGHRSTAPSQNDTAPGHAASPPGHSGGAPGQAGSPRGNSGSAPGHAGSAPGHGTSPPGHSGSAPGHGGAPPGQGKK
jgi:hypothetical protein